MSVHPLSDPAVGADVWKQTLFSSPSIPDYTFEERYVKGTVRPSYPERDRLDVLQLQRIEGFPGRANLTVATGFLEAVLANPAKIAYVWSDDTGTEQVRHSFRQLFDATRAVAYHLLYDYKFKQGDRLVLVYEPCVEFFAAFWGCILTGIVPVPVCPPDPFNLDGDPVEKLASIVADCSPVAILTSATYKDSLSAARMLNGDAFSADHHAVLDTTVHLWIATDTLTPISITEFTFVLPPLVQLHSTAKATTDTKPILMFTDSAKIAYESPVTVSDLAFLQYTSGSTGMAKGVMVHHQMLINNVFNCALLTGGLGDPETYQISLGVSWLPTFHDMGLIGFHITPILVGGTVVYLSPVHFIQNPLVWLRLCSRYRRVFSGAPPFALDLLCRRVTKSDLEQLDLSGLTSLVLGAEPIRAAFLENFVKTFKSTGFRSEYYVTCFGMAENVLHVAGKWGNRYNVAQLRIDSDALKNNVLVIHSATDTADTTTSSAADISKTSGSTNSTSATDVTKPESTEDSNSQWIVSSGELIPFGSETTLSREEVLSSSFGHPSRVPHFIRYSYASFISIVDPNTKIELPDGSVGEIWIFSPSKTAGYWNRPELSQEQFHARLVEATKQETKDLIAWAAGTDKPSTKTGTNSKSDKSKKLATVPFNLQSLYSTSLDSTTLDSKSFGLQSLHVGRPATAEWLRTGDMGVVKDNQLYITGRLKDMIILRGQNFYADDIESAIAATEESSTSTTAAVSKSESKAASQRYLNYVRPGSAVAYSIELTAKVLGKNIGQSAGGKRQVDSVASAGVEGEHLCLIVELTSDLQGSTTTGDGELLTDTEPDVSRAVKVGSTAPLWQRVLNSYAKQLVGGLSQTEEGDLDQVQARRARQTQSCNERMLVILRQSMFATLSASMSGAQFISKLYYGNSVASTSSTSEASTTVPQSPATADTSSSKERLPHVAIVEEGGQTHLPPDSETTRLQALYPPNLLALIASHIRQVITTKFLLPVDKIYFVAPRTIRKTSSGKKRRNDTVLLIERHHLDHRLIGVSYSKSFEKYNRLEAIRTKAKGSSSTQSFDSAVITNHDVSQLSANPKFQSAGAQSSTGTSTSMKSAGTQTPTQQFGGSVGIGFECQGNTVNDASLRQQDGLGSKAALMASYFNSTTGTTASTSGTADETRIGFQTPRFAPLLANFKKSATLNQAQQPAYERVKAAIEISKAATPEAVKPRLFEVICTEINALADSKPLVDDEETAIVDEEHETETRFACGNSLTVDYLFHVASLTHDEQQLLQESFGLDSTNAFRLGQAIANEFHIPTQIMGPHIFIKDPYLDGVVKNIGLTLESYANRLKSDYEAQYNVTFSLTEFVLGAGPAIDSGIESANASITPQEWASGPVGPEVEYDSHNKAAAYMFRGSMNPSYIPYILGIGTAVPSNCAPQEYVIEAMLGPMQMPQKDADRFRKIGAHSGVGTRYSVLQDLGQIFWGKEGINSGTDEFIDERQRVFKPAAVQLSIRSSMDAVLDWLGEKHYKNDEIRTEEREAQYEAVEKKHREYTEALRTAAETAAAAAKEKENVSKSTKTKTKLLDTTTSTGIATTSSGVALPTTENKTKSFAAGTTHIVPTTSGDSRLDGEIATLGQRIRSKFDRTITHIVAVTCTGVIVPGLEFHIMQALQLPLTTQRLPITFAGCFGAISGLRTASALAAENPTHRVLVVCTELCTLHMQLNDNIDNLIASALFADGSGAFIVGCAPTPQETPLFSVDRLSSFIIPNTVSQMAWEATKSGQVIGLAKEIAHEIYNVIDDVVEEMLQFTPDPTHPGHRIHPEQCNLALHPGGPLIVNSIQSVFGLSTVENGTTVDASHPVAETWKILWEYGNMSSATLVFVLDRLRENPDKYDKPTPALAFGPGLSIECCMLHLLKNNKPYAEKCQEINSSRSTSQKL